MEGATYTCALCGGTDARTVSEDEARAEMRAIFGALVQTDECALVCGPCWEIIQPGGPLDRAYGRLGTEMKEGC